MTTVCGDNNIWLLYYETLKKFFFMKNEIRYYDIINNIHNDFVLKKIDSKFKNNKKKHISNSDLELIGIGGYGQIYKLNSNICVKLNLTQKEEYHEYNIPLIIKKIDNELGDMIIQPYTLIKNCVFNGILNMIQLNILMVYFTYCYVFNKSYSSFDMKNKLKDYNIDKEYKALFKNNDKNIVNKSFEFFNFLNCNYLNPDEQIKIISFLLQVIKSFKKKNVVQKNGFLILMPYAEGNISVRLYLNSLTKEIDNNGVKAFYIYKDINRLLFLQISLFILKIKKHTVFLHNDLKPDNVLTVSINDNVPRIINYKNNSFHFYEHFMFKISDFDFSVLPCYLENKKVANSKLAKNRSWFIDIHNFVHKIFSYITEEEINADIFFFKKLHETFIFPFCGLAFTEMKNNVKINKSSEDICIEGMYMKNIMPEIELLEIFILSDLFTRWRPSSENIENIEKNISLNYIENNSSISYINNYITSLYSSF